MNDTPAKKILLVHPQYPDTFWSFKHILKFISKKAAFPPLGLLTIAAMLPREWEKKLIDLNVTALEKHDIEWADYVFISAMIVQRESVKNIIRQCKEIGATIVAGGPLFTTGYEEYGEVDHIVLGEAEMTLPILLDDLANGSAKPIYSSESFPDISKTPAPLWSLIRKSDYASMGIQYSRGCPFSCEFCDIIIMNGRTPRTKTTEQVIRELESLYDWGWRGSVFIVDDNFIGKKSQVKKMLPEIIRWVNERDHPFTFLTEASINLADDEELMALMVEAGFRRVFVGLETPVPESLAECKKVQNEGRDLVASVKKILHHGMEVLGGFILGFDNDPPTIFERQIHFIQKSGVVVAMVGLLNALPGTPLHKRLGEENRLLKKSSGNNVDSSLNFLPKMDSNQLIEGYRKVITTIYSPREYYERVLTFLKEYKGVGKPSKIRWVDIKALLRSFWYLGLVGKSRRYYWKLLAWSLMYRPKHFSIAVTMAIYGFHLQKIAAL